MSGRRARGAKKKKEERKKRRQVVLIFFQKWEAVPIRARACSVCSVVVVTFGQKMSVSVCMCLCVMGFYPLCVCVSVRLRLERAAFVYFRAGGASTSPPTMVPQ